MTPFTGAILIAGEARAAPLCPVQQAARNAASDQKRPASGGAYRGAGGPMGLWAALARCARHRPGSPTWHRAYPGDPIRAMKGVIISAPRY